MTNAVPIRIADAVTAELNSHSFDFGVFTAARSTGTWDKDFKGLDTLAVDVVIRKTGTTINMQARGSIRYNTAIIIAIRKRLGPQDRNELTGEYKTQSIDPLDTLLVDIAELFISERNSVVLDDETEANYEPSEIKPMLGNEHMLRQGLYYSFVAIEFNYKKTL